MSEQLASSTQVVPDELCIEQFISLSIEDEAVMGEEDVQDEKDVNLQEVPIDQTQYDDDIVIEDTLDTFKSNKPGNGYNLAYTV